MTPAARPLAPSQAHAPPTLRVAYSDRTAALMAALCEIAYAAPGAVAGLIAPAGFRLLAAGGRFILAGSPELYVLAFRGTEDAADWRVDINAPLVPWLTPRSTVRLHRGFLTAYRADRAAIRDALARHAPPAKVGLYVAGHSLGGALAQIATADLDSDVLAACYTFGSPRVGTRDFDRQVHAPHYRVVNGWDLVPGVPAPWLSGYRHTGDPRLLTGDGLEAYRRDRSLLARFGVDLLGLAGAAVTRRLPPVADHMIWSYRARLDEIAVTRPSRASCSPPISSASASA